MSIEREEKELKTIEILFEESATYPPYHPVHDDVEKIIEGMEKSNRISEVLDFANTLYGRSGVDAHYLNHVIGVAGLSTYFMKKDYPDNPYVELLQTAGLLHDFYTQRYSIVDHLVKSCKMAIELLRDNSPDLFDQHQLSIIAYGILRHSQVNENGSSYEGLRTRGRIGKIEEALFSGRLRPAFIRKILMELKLTPDVINNTDVITVGNLIWDADRLENKGRHPYALGLPELFIWALRNQQYSFGHILDSHTRRMENAVKKITSSTARELADDWITKYIRLIDRDRGSIFSLYRDLLWEAKIKNLPVRRRITPVPRKETIKNVPTQSDYESKKYIIGPGGSLTEERPYIGYLIGPFPKDKKNGS